MVVVGENKKRDWLVNISVDRSKRLDMASVMTVHLYRFRVVRR